MPTSWSKAAAANDTRELSLMGKIAAGTPIAAIEHETARYPVPESMLGAGEHYILEIEGDSMIEAGILNGDMVIIKKSDSANSGEIVVALLEDSATVKRFQKTGKQVWLLPENPAYQPIDGNEAQILGKVRAVIRTY